MMGPGFVAVIFVVGTAIIALAVALDLALERRRRRREEAQDRYMRRLGRYGR